MIPIRGQITGTKQTIAAFGQFRSLIRQAAMAAMRDTLKLFSDTVRNKFLVGPYPQFIERRTGSFRSSFQRGDPDNIWLVQGQGSTIVGTFGSQDKRARILNDGGTIRSSRPGGFLAIRTEFTKTPRGVVRAKYQAPLRTIPHTFVAKGTVFERIGRRIVPIAWLKRQVSIRGRRYMEQTQRVVEPLIPGIFQARVDTLLTRLQETLRRIGR